MPPPLLLALPSHRPYLNPISQLPLLVAPNTTLFSFLYFYFSSFYFFPLFFLSLSLSLLFLSPLLSPSPLPSFSLFVDVAARGLDIPKIQSVIHYDVARSPQVQCSLVRGVVRCGVV